MRASSLSAFAAIILISVIATFAAAQEHGPEIDDRCGIERARSEDAANAALEQCAAAGEAEAQTALGFLYWSASRSTYCRDGACTLEDSSRRGLRSGLTLEELQAEGRRLIEAAARGGSAEAQNELGLAYLNGDYGMTVDLSAAQYWLRAAVDGGDALAPLTLARMHFAGIGVEQSSSEAERLLRLSAQRGYARAQCSLAYWLSQYAERERRREAEALRATLARSGNSCGPDDILREMPLIRTDDTL